MTTELIHRFSENGNIDEITNFTGVIYQAIGHAHEDLESLYEEINLIDQQLHLTETLRDNAVGASGIIYKITFY